MKWTLSLFFLVLFLLFSGDKVSAVQIGFATDFFIDPTYDISGRTSVKGVFVKETAQLLFAVESPWWDSLNTFEKSEVLYSLDILAQEFENHIYPDLTSAFGSEWKPGVDNDPKITILIHKMKKGMGGYFREADEHLKLEVPESNEREMIYLALDALQTPLAKSFLAHEFVHLITFNQKDRLRKVSEEVWLNEARAEYAPTFLGYNTNFEGSHLKKRLGAFLRNPTDSLTEWRGEEDDYGVVSIFVHYLVDQYGVGILIDSLHSDKTGIVSLNEALKKNGVNIEFSQIFEDWAIAVFLNDCTYGRQYCYFNQNLKDLRITPFTNFLPLIGRSSLTFSNITKTWSANWLRFVGGQGALKFSFEGAKVAKFKIPYLIQDGEGAYTINFLSLDQNQRGEVFVEKFGSKNRALIVLPILQTKLLGFEGLEPTYSFSINVSILERTPQEEKELISQLLSQIDLLKNEIARLQAELKRVLGVKNSIFCKEIKVNLSFGMTGEDVRCLQQFLLKQGREIYPEGLVTGYFGVLTQSAVIRFQEKYAKEILTPLGLSKGTGVVGQFTARKMNELLTFAK